MLAENILKGILFDTITTLVTMAPNKNISQNHLKHLFNSRIPFDDYIDLVNRDTVVEDEQVLREVIGLFFGASADNAFQFVGGSKLLVKNAVSMKSMTSELSREYLKEWLRIGENMSCFLKLLYPKPGTTEDILPDLGSTLVSFLLSMREVLHQKLMIPLISQIDDLKSCHENSLTAILEKLTHENRNKLSNSIVVLRKVYDEIVQSDNFYYNYKCSAHVINVLFKHLDNRDLELRNILWFMFLDAIRPTLNYLQKMLNVGYYEDVKDEFLFDLGEGDLEHDENFWENCLILRGQEAVCDILKPSIPILINGIKSRLILIGCCENNKTETPKSIYDLFVQLVIESLSSEKKAPQGNSDLVPLAAPYGPLKDFKLNSFPNPTIYDTKYFMPNLDDINFELQCNPNFEITSAQDEFSQRSDSLPANLKTPLKLAIRKSLNSVIQSHASGISQQLMDSFKDIYLRHLKTHINYYLLQKPGAALNVYLDELFPRITRLSTNNGETFYSSIEHRFEEEFDVRAIQSHSKAEIGNPISVLQRVNIFYEYPNSFTRLLIKKSVKQVLSDAFHFVLTLKYCKWLLDSMKMDQGLHHDTPGSGDKQVNKRNSFSQLAMRNQRIRAKHELYILRFKLLEIVNSIHNHVMLKMHEKAVIVLKESETSTTFEHLINHLNDFIDAVAKYSYQKSETNLPSKLSTVTIKLIELFSKDFFDPNNNESLAKEIAQLTKVIDVLHRLRPTN